MLLKLDYIGGLFVSCFGFFVVDRKGLVVEFVL